MKLYLTGVPDRPGVSAVKALTEALRLINSDTTYKIASALIQSLQDERRPILLGETDDPEALKAARAKLAEAHMTCAQDLPESALVAAAPTEMPSLDEPDSPDVSYLSCQMALMAMQACDGSPANALHHCLTYARLVGETRETPGVWRDAVKVIMDTFPPTIQADLLYMLVDAGYVTDPGESE